jgi:1,4-alpha-glucan branching enzyme
MVEKRAGNPETPRLAAGGPVEVSFALVRPGASRVSVCGDFNGWATSATPLKRHEDGHWETTVALAPGQYQYKFMVDGEWVPDPAAQKSVANQYGSFNSVVEVRN